MASYNIRQRDPLLDSGLQAILNKRGKEMLGVGLICLAGVVAVMLGSYSPQDPSWMAATDAPVHNAMGRIGAAVASPLIIISGYGAWGLVLALAGWGVRFVIHRGEDLILSRVIFVPIAIALTAVWAASLVPSDSWGQSFGLGGLFGDTILGAMLTALPVNAAFGVKLMTVLLTLGTAAIWAFVLGFVRYELALIGRFLVLGLLLSYAGLIAVLRRGARGGARLSLRGAQGLAVRAQDQIAQRRAQAAQPAAHPGATLRGRPAPDMHPYPQDPAYGRAPQAERSYGQEPFVTRQPAMPAAAPRAGAPAAQRPASAALRPAPPVIRAQPAGGYAQPGPHARHDAAYDAAEDDAPLFDDHDDYGRPLRGPAPGQPQDWSPQVWSPQVIADAREAGQRRGHDSHPAPRHAAPRPEPAPQRQGLLSKLNLLSRRPADAEADNAPATAAAPDAHAPHTGDDRIKARISDAVRARSRHKPVFRISDDRGAVPSAPPPAATPVLRPEPPVTAAAAVGGAGAAALHMTGIPPVGWHVPAQNIAVSGGPGPRVHAPVQEPIHAPVQAPVQAPAQARAQPPVQAFVRTPVHTAAQTPAPPESAHSFQTHIQSGPAAYADPCDTDMDFDDMPYDDMAQAYTLPAPATPLVADPLFDPTPRPAGHSLQRRVVQTGQRRPPAPSRQAMAEAQPTLQFTQHPEPEYELPPLGLLASPDDVQRYSLSDDALEENARMLENVLDDYGVRGEIVSVRPGPVVTMYELEPAPGLKASRVIGLADDIARSMSALSARVSTVPGRSVIGIELPNAHREKVVLREILAARDFGDTGMKLPLALGKDIGGEPIVANLAKMPHLLIAGTTGSGKSVAINTMILSLLYKLTPAECRLIMIDPKMLELSVYDGIPHLLSPVVTDPKKAVVALKWVVGEMEDRYRKMSKMGVRNIDGFNGRVREALDRGEMFKRTVQTGFDDETGDPVFETEEFAPETIPYIVVIVDEMADLMMVAGKEIEACIQRLAQMARASGIHLIMATQRPSVDVITGTIKANFPTRISFQVTSKIDSRTILGEQGAEQLLGMGDMLYMAGGAKITRIHGPFVSDEEVEEIVNHLKSFGPPSYMSGVVEGPDNDKEADIDAVLGLGDSSGEDALYDQAVQVVVKDRKCSTSYIQRKLGIGYNKAARLVEQMEDQGVVTTANHVGKREILVPEQG